MDDLISRKVLIDFLDETVPEEEMLVSQYNADWIYSFIESAPTVDAVEVVRCKDCAYKFTNYGHDKAGCPLDATGLMNDNDFCSCGKKKEVQDEE